MLEYTVNGIEPDGEVELLFLVVSSHQETLDTVFFALRSENIEVRLVSFKEDIQKILDKEQPQAVLIDQMVFERQAFDCLQSIRAHQTHRNLPVLMLAAKESEEQLVEALEAGADDLMVEPFTGKSMVARIRAVIRRTGDTGLLGLEKLRVGDLTLDPASHKVLIEGNEVELTLTEFKILCELMKLQGQVLSRDQLRERALGSLNVNDRTVDVHMASLRKKLTAYGASIQTVRGVGYRFELKTGTRP